MNPVIAVDCDDVIAETQCHLALFHNETYGTNYTKEDVKSFFLEHIWQVDRDEAVRRVDQYLVSDHHDAALPKHGAQKSLALLQSIGFKIVIVTSRPVHSEIRTKQWLEKHFASLYNEVIFTSEFHAAGGLVTKAQICTEIGARVLVEDAPHYAIDVAGVGIPVLLFDVPWNQGVPETENVIRIHSWDEVVRWITKHIPHATVLG